MRKPILQTAIVLALSIPCYSALASSTITIDIDGSAATTGGNAGSNPEYDFTSFDWTTSSALILDATGLSTGTTETQLYTHSYLTTTDLGKPNGLDQIGDDLFEITYVLGAVEHVETFTITQVASGTQNVGGTACGGDGICETYVIDTEATFSLGSMTGGENFFEIWYDNTTATNPDGGTAYNTLDGTGYRDGTQILAGTIDSLTGKFGTTGPKGLFEYVDLNNNGTFDPGVDTLSENFISGDALVTNGGNGFYSLLDSFGDDDWSTNTIKYLSIWGEGSTSLGVSVDTANTDFFKDALSYLTFDLAFTTQVNDPFTTQQPSKLFYTESGTLANGTGFLLGDATGGLCGSGIICNGLEGPDQLLQVDASSNFYVTTPVPEPSILALMGLSLASLGMLGWSQKRRS